MQKVGGESVGTLHFLSWISAVWVAFAVYGLFSWPG